MNPARLLVLFLLLAGAAGGLYWLAQRPAVSPDLAGTVQTPEAGPGGLFELDPRMLARITLNRPRFNESVRVERGEDGIWRLTEPVRDWCEPAVLMSALQALYERDWTEAPAEWNSQSDAQLGLDPAELAVETLTRDGQRETLRIGAADLAGRWHAATRNGQRVRVGEGVLSRLNREVDDWRDHRLQPLPPPAVRALRWRAANGEVLALERSPTGWRLLAPLRAPLDPRREPFIERMLGGRAEQIARDPLALKAPAGEPLGTLSLEGSEETFTWTVYAEQLVASHRDFPLMWRPEDLGILFQDPAGMRSPRILDSAPGARVARGGARAAAAAIYRRGAAGWALEGVERALTPEETGLLEALVREGARLEGRDWIARPETPASGRVTYSISRTPRPQPGHVLEWWTDAAGRVTVAAADGDRAAPSGVNFDLAVQDLLQRSGADGAR